MSVVLDSSLALAWLITRPAHEEQLIADRVLASLARDPALVPPVWHVEIVRALLAGLRRGVLREATAAAYLRTLDDLPLETDAMGLAGRRRELFDLARRHDIAARDAAYLELALRRGAALATFAPALARAGRAAGLDVIG